MSSERIKMRSYGGEKKCMNCGKDFYLQAYMSEYMYKIVKHTVTWYYCKWSCYKAAKERIAEKKESKLLQQGRPKKKNATKRKS